MQTATERERGVFERPLDAYDRREAGRIVLGIIAAVILFSLGWAFGRNSLLEQTFVRDGAMTTETRTDIVVPAPVR